MCLCVQLPRARASGSPMAATSVAQDNARDNVETSLESKWRKVEQLIKVAPSKRSAMGGMLLRETDRENTLALTRLVAVVSSRLSRSSSTLLTHR